MWEYCWLVFCVFLTWVLSGRDLLPVCQTGGSRGQSGVNHLQILLPGETQNGLQVIDRYWGWAWCFFFLSWTHKQKFGFHFGNISDLRFWLTGKLVKLGAKMVISNSVFLLLNEWVVHSPPKQECAHLISFISKQQWVITQVGSPK